MKNNHGSYDNEKLYTEEELMKEFGISREKLRELTEQMKKEVSKQGLDLSDYLIEFPSK